MAVPSLMSNCLLSVPSACIRILPSVKTPSTSNNTSLMARAFCRAVTDAIVRSTMLSRNSLRLPRSVSRRPLGPRARGRACRGSEEIHAPQVVQVQDARDALRLFAVGDDERRDLALLHDV